ncbi:MAG: hypothetical protein RL556_323 [Actinomycetota bacterium]|jgi:heme/copper-type cytochrome/quinol oxidase subunit 2
MSIQFRAEDAAAITLPFPTFVIGVIAMVVFIALGLVTWSYRDVANRHDHKKSNHSGH